MEVLFKKVLENNSVFFYDNKNPIVHDDNEFGIVRSKSHPHFTYLKTIKNDNDVLKKEFGNPLCNVSIVRRTIVLEENEEKISLKVFFFNKERREGQVYFRKFSDMKFVTYNKKRCEIFTGKIRHPHKKRKRVTSVKRNCFYKQPFETLIAEIYNVLSSYNSFEKVNIIDKQSIHNELLNVLYKSLGIENKDVKINDFLFKKYLDYKGVKYPNNYEVFTNLVPVLSKRELKKNKMKMVETFMKRFELKGDRIRKILHEIKHINTYSIKSIFDFFGTDFLLQKDVKTIQKIFEQEVFYLNLTGFGSINFTKKEKNNCFDIFTLVLDNKIDPYTFIDHLNFYIKINKYEERKWNSNSQVPFHTEHIDWAEKVDYYSRATYLRKYNEEFINEIQSEIKYLDEKYYPVVLRSSGEYIEESSHQSNCVKGYVDRASSLIISLRKGSPVSKERATIEYRIRKNEKDNVRLNRVQTLGRFNNKLDSTWNTPIEMLDELIFDNISLFKEVNIDKITVLGTKQIKGIFSEGNNELVWEMEDENLIF